MKTLSKRNIIIAITALVVLVAVAAVVLSLKMLKYEDEVVPGASEVQSPYGNYDYSKRAFLTNSPIGGCQIYKGDAYFTTPTVQFVRVPLNELTCDLRTSNAKVIPQWYSVCPDTTHKHNTQGISKECPGWFFDPMAQFVIDAYESAGDFPIVYYYRSGYVDPEKEAWDQSATYAILRYDTGNNTRKSIASLDRPLVQMMIYDQSVFFITQSAQNTYQLNVVSKTNKENPDVNEGVTKLTIGKGKLTLLGVHNEQVIFRDADGVIYKADFDLQNCEKIVQVDDYADYSTNNQFQGVFMYDSYLYYCADYEAVPYPLNDDGTQVLDMMKHSIRRVSLDNPEGEGELVVENVYDDNMYGVVDDVFYYSPCIGGEEDEDYYYNFTGGLLKGVNLETLEPIKMNEDTGIFFGSDHGFVSGDALISIAFPVREGYNITHADGNIICLYDIKTGALYPLYSTG